MHKLAYKLFRVRKDGSIGSLFMNAKEKYKMNLWMDAHPHRKKGFQFRPGWHTLAKPQAPHLGINNRAWYLVEIAQYVTERRPASQGGVWYLSQRMRIIRPLNQQELSKSINYA